MLRASLRARISPLLIVFQRQTRKSMRLTRECRSNKVIQGGSLGPGCRYAAAAAATAAAATAAAATAACTKCCAGFLFFLINVFHPNLQLARWLEWRQVTLGSWAASRTLPQQGWLSSLATSVASNSPSGRNSAVASASLENTSCCGAFNIQYTIQYNSS